MAQAPTAKPDPKKQLAAALSPQESEALRITRELAREAMQAPRAAPIKPSRANRYIAP